MTRRKYRGTVFWVGVVFIAAGIYVSAFGPVVWLTARGHLRRSTVAVLYWPLLRQAVRGPRLMAHFIRWWGSVGVPTGDEVRFEIYNPEGHGGGVLYSDLSSP